MISAAISISTAGDLPALIEVAAERAAYFAAQPSPWHRRGLMTEVAERKCKGSPSGADVKPVARRIRNMSST
jgi:hypothetical protein